jgi:hypothetical protein
MLQESTFNFSLLTAMTAFFLAQGLKLIITGVTLRRIDFRRLVGSGGMPSSHAAGVTALTLSIGLTEGWNSALFAVAAVFAAIVIFDSTGVRRAAGKQAAALNAIVDDIYHHKYRPERLHELIGHTPFEVFAGILLGLVVSSLWWLLATT